MENNKKKTTRLTSQLGRISRDRPRDGKTKKNDVPPSRPRPLDDGHAPKIDPNWRKNSTASQYTKRGHLI